jgi:RNA polymerase-binding transcription factor DksA
MQDEATVFADPNDRASQESDMALELRNRDRERKLIKKIDETIARIDANEYGYCDSCGVEIGLKRLESAPDRDARASHWARRSTSCASAQVASQERLLSSAGGAPSLHSSSLPRSRKDLADPGRRVPRTSCGSTCEARLPRRRRARMR